METTAACRLDFFLISSHLYGNVLRADILLGFRTDHSLITLHFTLNDNPRGPGFWKLNTSLLSDLEYVNAIRETITSVVEQYTNDINVNEMLLWEMVKMEVRAKSISFSKRKKKNLQCKEKLLEEDILLLEAELEKVLKPSRKSEVLQELNEKKCELENIVEYKTKGAIIRGKVRWYNDGEKSTKYFLGLEKRHFNKKKITKLKTDNKELTSEKDILNEAKRFYSNLYTSKSSPSTEEQNNFFQKIDENLVKLNDQEQESGEGLLTKHECLESLKSMKNEKSPGCDGLPSEFYKVFWKDIADLYVNAINKAYKEGHLSISQRRGVITLLPKSKKNCLYLKNWRPITLLNCDYKIAAKAISSRVKKILPNIINNDQTGFQKGRFIGENIRLINDIINYTETQNIAGLLLFLDFEKAFDSLEWHFIYETLAKYNFGDSLISWIKLFYTDISSCILNNGWSSGFFELGRGVRQGCPLSPYLFLIGVEILATAIRENKNIKGISIGIEEGKISQYADDSTLILDGSQLSLGEALDVLDTFSNISGLKVNYDKTEALWIGALRKNPKTYFPNRPIQWSNSKVKALGISFSANIPDIARVNYKEKLEKIKNVLNNWQFRRLTLLGKITVIKSLAVSQLVYVLSSLETCVEVIDEVNTLLYNFLWDGKGDKVKRTTMINDYEQGGLKMIDLKTFNKALKISWLQKYFDPKNKSKWKLFLEKTVEKRGGELVFSGFLKKEDIFHLDIENPFYK